MSEMRTGQSTTSSLLLVGSLLLFVSQTNGQVSQIAAEWKTHFKETPVIKNCVFERKTFLEQNRTNLYQFRYQDNAFLMREIGSLNDIYSNHIARLNVYAGQFGSNYWAIDAGGVLKLFPNAEKLIKSGRGGDPALVFVPERILSSALYYGINELDPKTVEWLEASKFMGFSFSGEKYFGEVTKVSQGRPTALEWYAEKHPAARFFLEYKYEGRFDIAYYPSEIRLFGRRSPTSEKVLASIQSILMLETSATQLGEEFFDSKRYFVKSPAVPSTTLVFSNDQLYALTPWGQPQKVLPWTGESSAATVKKHSVLITVLFLGFMVFSVAVLVFIWNQKRTKVNLHQRNHQ